MTSKTAQIYKAHRSEKTKYYGAVFTTIIAVPIILFVFLFSQGTPIFAVGLSSVILAVLAVLGYLSFAGSNLNYAISDHNLKVNFSLIKKRIDYSKIVNAEAVNLNLTIRLFGASLPGFHWGLFKTSVGKAHVYATMISGDFIVITLNDGEKLVLSPAETTAFLEAMKKKISITLPQNKTELVHEEQVAKRLVYAQVLAVTGAYLIFLGYFLWVYASLPETVPVHFGFDGVANRWANKLELLLLPGIAVIFPAINAVLSLKFAKYERGMLLFLGAVFIAVTALFIVILNTIASIA
ncbi:MAG: DUF1648 domain-containing protein [Candidatus Bathyarchaeota archaeon]|nr:DUF1648 domain-containing protein [Candidatus Bathyarchaeota archaeon]